MKTISLIALVLLTSIHLKSQVLNVNQVTQEQNQWCWAGVSSCILDYYCAPTQQCAIAEYTRSVETFPDVSYGNTNCCISPSTCNNWNYSWGGPGSIQDILLHFANISNYGVGSCLTRADITADIQNNRVFVIRWGWTGGGGHFLVGHGLIGNNMYYMDPWFGEGLKIADYNWVVSGGNHTWTHTNRLSDSPSNNQLVITGEISGSKSVCLEKPQIYSITPVSGATSYTWTLPSGWSGSSKSTSITCRPDSSGGTISVVANNSCGTSEKKSLRVNVAVTPAQPGTISGITTVCQGDSQTYSIQSVSGATSYTWTLPSGWSGSSKSTSITCRSDSSGGTISVVANNSCGTSEKKSLRVNVAATPAQPGTISGITTVCQGQNSVTYTVPSIANATSYVWTLPSGVTGASTTNSIFADFGGNAISGNITVKGTNSCGSGKVSILPIVVNVRPNTPTITLNELILQSDAPNGNQWYNQNGLINGAVNQKYTISADGDFYVVVSMSGCSSNPSNIIRVSLTGIDAVETDRTIKVHPNPISNEITIEKEGVNGKVRFDILNIIGQIVFKGDFDDKTTIQTNKFAPGVYFIKIENGNIFKFIKINE